MSKAEPQDVDFVKLLVCDMEKFVQFANLIPLPGLQCQKKPEKALVHTLKSQQRTLALHAVVRD